LAYMSSGVSPRTIAETKKTDNATDQQLITNHWHQSSENAKKL